MISSQYERPEEERMKTDWNVGDLLSVSSGYWRGCALHAAVRLDFFTHIGTEKQPVDAIAGLAATDKRATKMLLNALTAMGLLQKQQSYYTNTGFSRTYLCRDSAQYMGHIILHHHHILDGWAQLDQAVISGTPVEKRSYGEEIERQSFLMGMFNLAMELAPQLTKHLDLSGRRRLLDLGGGPGTYAIHFCRANPELTATIFDRPTTRPFAEKTVASFGLQERISFEAGDFTCDPITGGPFDAAWLSHILHSNGIDQCYEIVNKTVGRMEKGGIVFIHDFILNDNKDAPEFGALFSLNMLINNPHGRAYSEKEIRSMLRAAGVSDVKRHSFTGPNDSSILFGVA